MPDWCTLSETLACSTFYAFDTADRLGVEKYSKIQMYAVH